MIIYYRGDNKIEIHVKFEFPCTYVWLHER